MPKSSVNKGRNFADLISDIFWSIDGGHEPRYGIWNQAAKIYSKAEDYEIENNTHRHRIRMRENGGSLDFNLISLLNPAVDKNWVCRHRLWQFFLQKMMLCTMFRSIQTFSVNGKFTERYHIFCAQTDLLLTISICSRYRLCATIRLLHHFMLCNECYF